MTRRPKTLAERFEGKVAIDLFTGCHVWTGAKQPTGYGTITLRGRRVVGAHRVAYELAKGPIPTGLHIDHLCRNRACVNPDHLEAVTPSENTKRGFGIGMLNAAKTHCLRGHPYDAKDKNGFRICTKCRRAKRLERERPLWMQRGEERP